MAYRGQKNNRQKRFDDQRFPGKGKQRKTVRTGEQAARIKDAQRAAVAKTTDVDAPEKSYKKGETVSVDGFPLAWYVGKAKEKGYLQILVSGHEDEGPILVAEERVDVSDIQVPFPQKI